MQDWDGNPHTWTISWDETSATLARDGVQLVYLDVTGQDLSVGTMWLPLNTWDYGYSHPIGSVYSNLSLVAWLPGGGGSEEEPGDPEEGLLPIEDVGAGDGYGMRCILPSMIYR